ncbi:HAD superfamily hydrolase [Secundilactobacillus odoratitofui DSM 19909 = JCM 15043]|uniref:HAD superfamily hydrolase n=2 Tax=Secundilactobacillus odoratitofui TaxID=480930 RepID=A0A0R1LQW0_9LACO|nr:HAD family hydrolase [Secundilactobacillus odoratitofui]KRK98203.1 HAD superfamily hydrolase [Secundilactobacillus odoratitofui DSM 19909 = JCM 15043]
MIKAIVFDLDDTLYDQQRPFQQALLSVWNDPAVSGSVLNDLFSTFKQLNDRVTTLETLNMTQVFDQLNTVLAHHDLPALAGSVWLAFWDQYQKEAAHIHLFTEIKDQLTFLKDHYQLGIITNGTVEAQSQKALKLNLHQWIDRKNMVISEEVGLIKPDARIFTYFNRLLNLQANEVVYIGDNFNNDMLGAKQAGWHAFWFNHRGLDLPKSDYIPDQTVESPAELAELLQAMTVTAY